MIDLINENIVKALWLVPVNTGVVEVIKIALEMNKRFVPLASLTTGILLGILVAGVSIDGVLAGIIIGLGSVGLFEVGKTTIQNK